MALHTTPRRHPFSLWRAACRLRAVPIKRLLSMFRVDAGLPPSGLKRWGTIAYMVVGGIVALLVPVFLGVMLWYYVFGEAPPPTP